MIARRWLSVLVALALGAVWLAACAPTASPPPATVVVTQMARTQVVQGTPLVVTATAERPTPERTATLPSPTHVPATPQPTALPATLVPGTRQPTIVPPTASPVSAPPTPAPAREPNTVELEWPARMRLGDSDLVRLALVPASGGYVVTTEFPGHETVTATVPVERLAGYTLSAVARLDGVGFDMAPQGDQPQSLPPNETVTWRWTITPRAAGQQGLSVRLTLHWTPQPDNPAPAREAAIYSKGLQITVTSFFGLTTREATATGLTALLLGGGFSLPLALYVLRPPRLRSALRAASPSPGLVIEGEPAVALRAEETTLLRALFGRYARVRLESEFRSGYSGARTLLALPVRSDGRADAYTIVKIGERGAIDREFRNYETFVKDTLPPVTARIQENPVVVRVEGRGPSSMLAGMRYTFIGEPGRSPFSLREALLANPDPALIEKLFDTFGPNWWLQRRPHTFRLSEEYDRMLPAHFVLEPVAAGGKAVVLDGREMPADVCLELGEWVRVRAVRLVERRPDGKWLSLAGTPPAGCPPLRLRWLGTAPPRDGCLARVVATRETLLRDLAAGFDRCGLPDPLDLLPAVLDERVMGTQSTIHGDLNLENVLVGPAGFVWLIDFAQTRDGHPLFDFAHLEAEIVAHVLAPRFSSAADLVAFLSAGSDPLLGALHAVAGRCLFNPVQPREYDLALFVAVLGALKHANLEPWSRHALYLTAAFLAPRVAGKTSSSGRPA